jgi:hypothetical protein
MQVAWSPKTTFMMPQELSRLRNQGVGFFAKTKKQSISLRALMG